MVLQQDIETVQNRAVRFVTRNYCFETGSMTGPLQNLKWESLKKRRRASTLTLILFYKRSKGSLSTFQEMTLFHSLPPSPTLPQLGTVEIISLTDFSDPHYKNLHLKELILPSNNRRLECPSIFDHYLC